MPVTVCIAEKPSVAQEIAKVIGATTRREGYFEGNDYRVTWTFGHFCTLYPPEDYRPDWKRWDMNSLPMLPDKFQTRIMDDPGVKKQFAIIQKLFSEADLIINCGDAGQEGELIQRWVLKETGYSGEVKRLWISSLTNEAIKEGFEKLQPAGEFDNLYYAGSSRAIGDWLLGMNASRIYTLKYGAGKQVLSIGRVQTPTLAMVVKRHEEIVNFKPEPYWELQTVYRETTFNATSGKFTVQEEGEQALQKIEGKDLFITKVEQKEGKEYAPRLFDLTSLQVYCNSKFSFTADATLKIAQRLYEKKVLTYPRVDTTFLPTDMYPKVPGILKGMQAYAKYTEPLLGKKLRKSTKVFNDKKITDHHAIVPTGEQLPLSADEQKVYDAVARRFIAVFYPDCDVAKTQVDAQVEGVDFVTRGKVIVKPGWRVLFDGDKASVPTDKDEDNVLPPFEEGEHGPHEPSFAEKTTKPPKYYTEATLLRAMETAGKQVEDEELRDLMKANGIGRPSTRASIIETLFRRKYAERQKKKVVPTPIGVQLINTISNELLKSAELTGQWEKQLRDIENGEYSAGRFIKNMKRMVDHLVFEVRTEKQAPIVPLSPTPTEKRPKSGGKATFGEACPKCKEGKVVKGKSSFGCLRFKEGCDFRIPFVFMDKKLTDKQVATLIQKGVSPKMKGFISEGEKVEGKIILSADGALSLETTAPPPTRTAATFNPEGNPTCPECGKGTIVKGKTAYGCTNWKNGCTFRMPFNT
ncbi:MAG: DNA topoisomerase 3 [Flavobacteriales bacterium]|nr:DNA topoisomerase 3 [Flavobacteriales bacterium]